MQPRILHPTLLRRYNLVALVLCILFAGLSGFGLSRFSRHKSSPGDGFPAQAYDYHPSDTYKIGVPLRPMDTEIFDTLASGKYSRADLGDLFPKRPYHVRFIGNAKEIDVVLIDLERDGTWEERWQLRPEGVQRRILDKTGRSPGMPFELRTGRWVPY